MVIPRELPIIVTDSFLETQLHILTETVNILRNWLYGSDSHAVMMAKNGVFFLPERPFLDIGAESVSHSENCLRVDNFDIL